MRGLGRMLAGVGAAVLAGCMEAPGAATLADSDCVDCDAVAVAADLVAQERRGAEIAAGIDALTPGERADLVLAAFEGAGCPPDIPIGGDAYQDYYERVLQRLGASVGMQGDEWRVFRDGLDELAQDEGAALVAAERLARYDDLVFEPLACAGST